MRLDEGGDDGAMVGCTGLEPVTNCLRGSCSTIELTTQFSSGAANRSLPILRSLSYGGQPSLWFNIIAANKVAKVGTPGRNRTYTLGSGSPRYIHLTTGAFLIKIKNTIIKGGGVA